MQSFSVATSMYILLLQLLILIANVAPGQYNDKAPLF